MDATLFTILIVALLLVAAAILLVRKRRSDDLARRFGPEYHRTVETLGSRSRAEEELLARDRRVKQLHLEPLAPDEAERFSAEWRSLQSRFVDSPQGVLAEADVLVRALMQRRGYPMADFETRAADISVDHPRVVENYRAAHDIMLRDRAGQADTEALRQAIVHYRALFSELLEVAPAPEARRAAADEPQRERRRGGLFQSERAMARKDAAARERERRSER